MSVNKKNLINGLFVHDHVFLRYKGHYYSNGKLTYNQLKYYLKYCDCLDVVGRFRDVEEDPGEALKSEGANIKVHGMENILSFRGIVNFPRIRNNLQDLIKKSNFVVSRLPSEYGILSVKICRKLGVPNLVEMVASPFDCLWYRGDIFAKIYAPILSFRTKYELRFSKYVIYVTNKYLQKHYPTNGESLGVSDAVVSVNSKVKNIKSNKVKVGVIGNPNLKLKGIDVLYSAVNQAKHDNPEFELELHIIGGSLSSDIEVKFSNEDFIIQHGFIGNKDKLYDIINSFDIYVQPSFTEGLPRSVIEAMSCGLPSLGSNVGGIPEIVNTELLFKAGDSKKLSEIISKLLNNSEFYCEMSEHSITMASKFNDEAQVFKDEFVDGFSKIEN